MIHQLLPLVQSKGKSQNQLEQVHYQTASIMRPPKKQLGTLIPIEKGQRVQRHALKKLHSQSPSIHKYTTISVPPQILRNSNRQTTRVVDSMKMSIMETSKVRGNSTQKTKEDGSISQSRTVGPILKVPIGNQTYSVTFFYQTKQFFIDKGNNHELIRRILQKRTWLIEQLSSSNVNFRWKPTSKDLNYANLSLQPGQRRVIYNHIEHHKEITTKQKLYANLRSFCLSQKINHESFIPQTFILNIDGPQFQQELKSFIDEYLRQKFVLITSQMKLQKSKNFWIVKPPDLNRGQGIQLCNDLKQFIQQLLEFCKLKPSVSTAKTVIKNVQVTYPSDKHEVGKDPNAVSTINFQVEQIQGSSDRQIVIQKYLEQPLLYKSRKFDFRVWVLLDHQLQYYFFKEGYLRLSSEAFELSSTSCRNLFIHLTNNAIQKNHNLYSKMELGNQLSFPDLQQYLSQKQSQFNVKDHIIPKMKELIKLTFNSVHERFSSCVKKFQFEIFGFDFMIDAMGNLWLIEVNTNPCIEESSPLLEKLVPRMLNDAFRLTIDKVLSPFKQSDFDRGLPDKVYDFLHEFDVPGYNNNDNLWEYMGKF